MRGHGKSVDEMTPEQRAAIESIRAGRHTPEADAERERIREAIRQEYPPAAPHDSLLHTVASLRLERERQGLTLAEISASTGMDPATLSRLETGKVVNPTYNTIRSYATALGKQVSWLIEDEVLADGQT